VVHADRLVEFVADRFGGQNIDLPSEEQVVRGNGGVCLRWIGLDIGTSQGGDILPRRVVGVLGPGTGEDDFLLERGWVVAPKSRIFTPNTFRVENGLLKNDTISPTPIVISVSHLIPMEGTNKYYLKLFDENTKISKIYLMKNHLISWKLLIKHLLHWAVFFNYLKKKKKN
jgi:hypothetical protein